MAKPFMRLKLNLSRIDKTALFKGEKGTYGDFTIMLNDTVDKYGNHGFVTQDLGMERRAKGERGPILGNGKMVDGSNAPSKPSTADEDPFA
jgi:hypothetical protein